MDFKCPECKTETVLVPLIKLDALLFLCPNCKKNVTPRLNNPENPVISK